MGNELSHHLYFKTASQQLFQSLTFQLGLQRGLLLLESGVLSSGHTALNESSSQGLYAYEHNMLSGQICCQRTEEGEAHEDAGPLRQVKK